MKYADKRAEGIAMIRRWASDQAQGGCPPIEIYREIRSAMSALIDEFLFEFDTPGARYWEHPETGSYRMTWPGEAPIFPWRNPIELARHEFLSRQGHHFDLDGRL